MPPYAIERDPLLADERPHTLAKRVEEVLAALAAATGAACAGCATMVCAHDALASLVLGFHREPRCTDCLARETGRDAGVLRDELAAFVLSKECLTVGWRFASASAHDSRCAWSGVREDRRANASEPGAEAPAALSNPEPAYHAEWNAGDLACGELVLELRHRLRAMKPGTIIKVTARDAAARQDMPAWCRLTGHALVYAAHPEYFIRRKEE